MRTATLKMISSSTFIQCKSAIADEIWSNFLRSHITLQHMFCSLVYVIFGCAQKKRVAVVNSSEN